MNTKLKSFLIRLKYGIKIFTDGIGDSYAFFEMDEEEAYALAYQNYDRRDGLPEAPPMQHTTPLYDDDFRRTRALGLLDETNHWNTKKVSKYQIAYWVEIYARRHEIKNKWKWASVAFGITDLRKARNYSINEVGKVIGAEIIENCFA